MKPRRKQKRTKLFEKCMFSAEPLKAATDLAPSPQVSSALFFQYNTALVPPYNVLVDTNFLSHTVQRKLELVSISLISFPHGACYNANLYVA